MAPVAMPRGDFFGSGRRVTAVCGGASDAKHGWEEHAMQNPNQQRMIIYAIGAVVIIVLLIIFLTN